MLFNSGRLTDYMEGEHVVSVEISLQGTVVMNSHLTMSTMAALRDREALREKAEEYSNVPFYIGEALTVHGRRYQLMSFPTRQSDAVFVGENVGIIINSLKYMDEIARGTSTTILVPGKFNSAWNSAIRDVHMFISDHIVVCSV